MYLYTETGQDGGRAGCFNPAPVQGSFVDWGGLLLTACVVGGCLWLIGQAGEERKPKRRRVVRNAYLYRLRSANRAVYYGITNQPERRCAEHFASGKRFTAMDVLGVGVTRASALERERAALTSYWQRYGRLPRYNKI